MAKPVNITSETNTDVSNVEKVQVELTKEELEALQNLQAEKEAVQKQKEEVEARAKEISDAEMKRIANATQKTLKNTQKMVTITVPVSERNPKDLVVPVTINGYTWRIKRGEEVTVPEEVKNILKEAKYI